MAPFSWSRRNTRSVHDDASEGVQRSGQTFDFSTTATEKAERRLQPLTEPGERTSSLVQHSRSSTMTSTMSFYEHSTSEASLTQASTSPSEDPTQDQPSHLPESKRNLFSKGSRYLKRHGSKLSLTSSLSTQNFEPQNLEDSVPSLPSPERISKHARKDSAAVVRRDVIKRTISEPFDFHHVTHTNRSHFGDFERTHDRELIGDFSAIRAGQQSKKEIRGFRVDSLAEMQRSVDMRDNSRETSPITTPMPSLPTSPARPAPPPKDSPTGTPLPKPIDVRLSRSVENFSRPSPRSPVSPVRPSVPGPAVATVTDSSEHNLAEHVPAESNTNYTVDTLPGQAIPFPPPLDKPLPEIPVSLQCHAVTTDDDTARPLRSVPLPSLPFQSTEMLEDENSVLGSTNPPDLRRRSLRHMHTFPSAQPSDRRSKRGSTTLAKPFPDPVTHNALQKVVASAGISGHAPPSRKRVAAGFGAIEIQNWEDAVDYSWDHDAEAEIEMDWQQDSDESTETAATIIDHLASRDVQESPQSPTIAPLISLAPLTIDTSDVTLSGVKRSSKTSKPRNTHSSQNSLNILHGLGIQQSGASFTPSHSHSSSDTRDGKPKLIDRPSLSHQSSSYSNFSKSSSQESIILSIASSIMSTQRSSNSTSSMTDLTPSTLSAEQSFSSEPQTPKDDYCDCTKAHVTDGTRIRRMSDCSIHPPADHLVVPAMETLKATKFDRRLVQFTDGKPATVMTTLSHRRAKSLASSLNAGIPTRNSVPISDLQPTATSSPSHSRKSSSGSRIPVPRRLSSIVAPEPLTPSSKKVTSPTTTTASKTASRRHRSATTTATGTRPSHKSRASYSLFPGATTPVPMSPLPTLTALKS